MADQPQDPWATPERSAAAPRAQTPAPDPEREWPDRLSTGRWVPRGLGADVRPDELLAPVDEAAPPGDRGRGRGRDDGLEFGVGLDPAGPTPEPDRALRSGPTGAPLAVGAALSREARPDGLEGPLGDGGDRPTQRATIMSAHPPHFDQLDDDVVDGEPGREFDPFGEFGEVDHAEIDGAQFDDAEIDDAEIDEAETKAESRRNVIEWAVVLVGAVLLALVLRTLVLQAFWIPSPSMESTLQVRDRVLVNKLSYRLHDVNRGDVVVFRRTDEEIAANPDLPHDVIKRVIALGGETIEISDNQVLIDGKLLQEPYLDEGVQTSDFAAQMVPEGHVFVMGDNRELSLDSRFDTGPVAVDRVVGRAFFLFWPLDRLGSL